MSISVTSMATAPPQAMATARAHNHGGPSGETGGWGRFARHYGEMAAAMMPGCALGCMLAAQLAGTWASTSGLSLLLMAFLMSLTMAGWMRYRGHGWHCTLEMTGSMFVAPILLLPVLWLGILSPAAVFAITDLAMFPAMLAVMLFRKTTYFA